MYAVIILTALCLLQPAKTTPIAAQCGSNLGCRNVGLGSTDACCPNANGEFLACCSEGDVATEYQCKNNPGCVAVGLTGANDCCSAQKDLACCKMGNRMVHVNKASFDQGSNKVTVTFHSEGLTGNPAYIRFTNAPGSILEPNTHSLLGKYNIQDVYLGSFTGSEQTYTVDVPSGAWTNIRVYSANYYSCGDNDMPYVNCVYPEAMVTRVTMTAAETTEMLQMHKPTHSTDWPVQLLAAAGVAFLAYGAFKHYTSSKPFDF